MANVSSGAIEDMSGAWEDTLRPFVPGFLIPRIATRRLLRALSRDRTLAFVTGDPLTGKSNVLRELAEVVGPEHDCPVLFVEGDGFRDGLYQGIANQLDAQLGWPASRDDVRRWLRLLSISNGKTLTIAVDGLPRRPDALLGEIEELVSAPFGPGVRVALAAPLEVVRDLQEDEGQRKASKLGRASTIVTVGPLSEAEVGGAADLMYHRRLGLMDGFKHCREYRTPWVLRAVMAQVAADPRYADANLMSAAPSVLSLRLFALTRHHYGDRAELRARYRTIAKALIKDLVKPGRSPELELEGLAVFALRRKWLRTRLDADDISALKTQAALAEAVVEGERVFVPRLPELMATELAAELGKRLKEKMEEDPGGAADWLVRRAASLPMGDLIGAQAILESAKQGRSLPLPLIESLLSARPHEQAAKPGTEMAMRIPGAGVIRLKVRKGGKLDVEAYGEVHTIEADGPQTLYADTESWSILAHLAGIPMGLFQNGQMVERADPVILAQVGSAEIPLHKPPHDMLPTGLLVHETPDGSILSHVNGVVEPITQAISDFLSRRDDEVAPWLSMVAASKSAPLIVRTSTALSQLATMETLPVGMWAKQQLDDLLLPALDTLPSNWASKAAESH